MPWSGKCAKLFTGLIISFALVSLSCAVSKHRQRGALACFKLSWAVAAYFIYAKSVALTYSRQKSSSSSFSSRSSCSRGSCISNNALNHRPHIAKRAAYSICQPNTLRAAHHTLCAQCLGKLNRRADMKRNVMCGLYQSSNQPARSEVCWKLYLK